MVVFFTKDDATVYAVDTDHQFDAAEIERLQWLFGGAQLLSGADNLAGAYTGPRIWVFRA